MLDTNINDLKLGDSKRCCQIVKLKGQYTKGAIHCICSVAKPFN